MKRHIHRILGLAVVLMFGMSMSTNAAVLESGDDDVLVYPNPASNVINIELGDDLGAASSITVHNLIGQLVYTADINSDLDVDLGCYIVEITDLPSGIYLLKIKAEDKVVTQRFTKR